MLSEHTDFARALRNNPTDAEFVLWRALSQVRPRFTRQLKLSPYTADVACRSARLIIEIDGSHHAGSANDAQRTASLEANGWMVVRFWNNEVLTNVEGVVSAIFEAGNPRLPPEKAFAFVASRAGRERKARTRVPKEEK
jgi:very-short-patch-repair endonuclease